MGNLSTCGTVEQTMHERLICRLVQADLTPAQLALEMGLSLTELAAWAAQPGNLHALESLARLADIRTQMLLTQYRANAALQLIQIASSKEHSELSRKACVDLLATNLDVFSPENATAHAPATDYDAASEEILAALERLGQAELDATGTSGSGSRTQSEATDEHG